MGLGDFLSNSKNLDLGTRWDGLSVNDVKLPPWASDSRDFTNKCRCATGYNSQCEAAVVSKTSVVGGADGHCTMARARDGARKL